MAKKPPFNLQYRFGTDLKPIPEDKASMQSYVDFLLKEIKKIPFPAAPAVSDAARPPENLRALVKFLGEVGSYSIILGKHEGAAKALEKSLELIENFQLGSAAWAVHTLRYGDVLRLKKDDLGAETAFRSVLEFQARDASLAELEDFAWQHLGRLRFDQGQLKEAEEFFTKALELRQKKNIPELVSTTQFALDITRRKRTMKR
ncbi:MAG: tetratricopeptide repeat protein [Bdellovibrionaceae bacterium]|nr:tetratricopeptide repeat protein [Pseudobdellovibrionaceae bacterium]MBX3033501.1 tetratricopeptide repeat protein [Pseudobdellovibrionaceae bacterium]